MERIGGPGYKKGGGSFGSTSTDEDEPTEEASGTPQEARIEAAQALIRAVKMGDAEAADEAMYAHHRACKTSSTGSDAE